MIIHILLSKFQTTEVAHGLSVDADDGRPVWGVLDYNKSRQVATLTIVDPVAAIWRISSSRDIWADNAHSDFTCKAGARSLTKLVNQLVELAGGRDAVLALPAIPRGEDADLSGADLGSWI